MPVHLEMVTHGEEGKKWDATSHLISLSASSFAKACLSSPVTAGAAGAGAAGALIFGCVDVTRRGLRALGDLADYRERDNKSRRIPN